jgi:hypothetical protein
MIKAVLASSVFQSWPHSVKKDAWIMINDVILLLKSETAWLKAILLRSTYCTSEITKIKFSPTKNFSNCYQIF